MTSAEPPAVRSATPEPPNPPTAAPVYSDLWDPHGDEWRDNRQFELEAKASA